ncbi:hypothetical protein FO519_010080 [Halicephalobus sp. NKZ332]|nr:hypothetical protein FO519_010080 [Halicephalobus sp. NKZ332]
MKLFIELHDHEEQLHRDLEWTFSTETTVDQLKDKVASVFQINPDYQRLFFNGSRIRANTLHEVGVKGEDTVVVKHSNIDVWANVVKRAADIKSKDTMDQPKAAQHTLELIELLVKSNFFLYYHNLLDEMERISREAEEYFGGDRTTMEMATRQYFFDWLTAHEYLKDPRSFDIYFGRKIGGIHSGCIATVCYDGTNDIYLIKTHHMGPTKSSSKPTSPPDLREVFAYVLLEAIGLGPKCHFFGPPPGMSKTTLYIGTKSILNLKLMEVP